MSYLGRDIEDAFTLKILEYSSVKELKEIYESNIGYKGNIKEINNTVIINSLVNDLCGNSSLEKGLCFSENYLRLVNAIKKYNYKNIYLHPRLNYFKAYAKLIIESLYDFLKGSYRLDLKSKSFSKYDSVFPIIYSSFYDWLIKYSNIDLNEKEKLKYRNKIVYDISGTEGYLSAIIDYISSMTDNFAIKCFTEITSFS